MIEFGLNCRRIVERAKCWWTEPGFMGEEHVAYDFMTYSELRYPDDWLLVHDRLIWHRAV